LRTIVRDALHWEARLRPRETPDASGKCRKLPIGPSKI
jgi:hypothetical protein